MSKKIFDPTPSQQKLIKEYFYWNEGKPRLLTCVSKYYYLTRFETFMVRCGLLSIKKIDRYQTRLARFNILKATMANKAKKRRPINPFLWSHPKSGKPVLFTSMGIVYELSLLDRLMLKFKRTNVQELNKKAVGKIIPYRLADHITTPYYADYEDFVPQFVERDYS